MRAVSKAVVIGNGVAGAENQCLGLLRALGLSRRHTLYRVTRPRGGINDRLRWLPVSLHKKLEHAMKWIHGDLQPRVCYKWNKVTSFPANQTGIAEADAENIARAAHETFEKYVLGSFFVLYFIREGPTLVVASGRDTISTASSIKRLAPENVFLVQIQHPRSHLSRFDLVITPRHDYFTFTPEGQKQIPSLIRRWITPYNPPEGHVVLTLGSLHQVDFSSLQSAASAWHDEIGLLPKPLLVVNIGGPIGPNPHMGHLALADSFVITADSISMLSEACSTGKPVYVIGAERCTWKFTEFHRSLRERSMVRPFTGKENISTERWTYSPLNDTKEGAGAVINALADRGWRLP
ncbi:hypothetical protein DM860_003370 [Cuscuta australis]|uniref:Mitochondrial fission protein ELM1 n=1 Tax=Cuscuta australis TaxID=267555 RepID=A0A328DKB2_9ASTE|nr:hypothetical protein DM860_003370 [Cuscuta australis]